MKKRSCLSLLAMSFMAIVSGCVNNELPEAKEQVKALTEECNVVQSRGVIDYSQYTLLEKRTVMSRTGEYFQGTVTYKDTAFPFHVYWDLDIED